MGEEYRIRVCVYGEQGELPSDWSEEVSYTVPVEAIDYRDVEEGYDYEIAAADVSAIEGKIVIPEGIGAFLLYVFIQMAFPIVRI